MALTLSLPLCDTRLALCALGHHLNEKTLCAQGPCHVPVRVHCVAITDCRCPAPVSLDGKLELFPSNSLRSKPVHPSGELEGRTDQAPTVYSAAAGGAAPSAGGAAPSPSSGSSTFFWFHCAICAHTRGCT